MQMFKLERWRLWARQLKNESYALYFACKDPRTPWFARLMAAVVIGYALSPIDLIPDAIPVLGYLDDLILIPLGIALVIRLVPHEVLSECRLKAQRHLTDPPPRNRIAAAAIICVWLALLAAAAVWTAPLIRAWFPA